VVISGAFDYAHIQGGSFIMGSPSTESGRGANENQRPLTVNPFFIGKYEVTQREYQGLMGANPSHFKGANLPVENITWLEALRYCNARSLSEGLSPAYTIGRFVSCDFSANGYRLPTEAEWEYACRAGTTSPYYTGNSITSSQARFNASSTVIVGSFPPNQWEIYDIQGNVSEWCWDDFTATVSFNSDESNDNYIVLAGLTVGAGRPIPVETDRLHFVRGGDFHDTDSSLLRSAFRGMMAQGNRSGNVGFRLVRSATAAVR
jgi:formylglycine-generating enzyme required for sulfatase activity